MIIKQATKENIDNIFLLNDSCFSSEKLSRESIIDYIDNKTKLDTVKIIYNDDNIFAGYITYRINDISELLQMAIIEKNRRQGYAKKLIDELISDAKTKNSDKVMLEVRTNNEKAINLYKKCGFNIIDTRKDYYKEPNDNAYIMEYVMEKKC